MAKARSSEAGREKRTIMSQGPSCGIPSADALALIKASGILNRNVKLDEIMRLSERLGVEAEEEGHIFIFKNVVLIKCTF